MVTGSHDTTIKLWDLAAGRSPLKCRSDLILFSSLCGQSLLSITCWKSGIGWVSSLA